MTAFLLSQIIAAKVFCSDLIAFYLIISVYVLHTLAFSTFILSHHFVLLEKYSASAMMLLAYIRFLVATHSMDRRIVYFFIGSALIACALTWRGVEDLLPLGGSLMLTFAAFQTNDSRQQFFTLIGSLFLTANNIVVQSPVATLMERTFFVSTLTSLIQKNKLVQ